LLFESSIEAVWQLDELFEFIWPVAIATWNLRWQVDGFTRAHPDFSTVELSKRFVSDAHINPPHKTEYSGLDKIVSQPWEQVRSNLGQFLILTSFAVFEGFLSALSDEVGTAGLFENPPLVYLPDGTYDPAPVTLQSPALAASPRMAASIGVEANKHRYNGNPRLHDLLKVYWAFKAARNLYAHGKGIRAVRQAARIPTLQADLDTITALPSAQAKTEFKRRFGVGMLTLPLVSASLQVETPINAVVGLVPILRQLIYAYDSEILSTVEGEQALRDRFADPANPANWQLNWNDDKGRGRARNYLKQLGIPCVPRPPAGVPDPVEQIFPLMKAGLEAR
jgi:hypothetical protein